MVIRISVIVCLTIAALTCKIGLMLLKIYADLCRFRCAAGEAAICFHTFSHIGIGRREEQKQRGIRIFGRVLLSTFPRISWMRVYFAMTRRRQPLSGFGSEGFSIYFEDRGVASLRRFFVGQYGGKDEYTYAAAGISQIRIPEKGAEEKENRM